MQKSSFKPDSWVRKEGKSLGYQVELHDTYAYGLWGAVLFNVLFALAFAVSFLAQRRKREWRSMGLLSAFIVALFTEMFGLPYFSSLTAPWTELFDHPNPIVFEVFTSRKENTSFEKKILEKCLDTKSR